MTTAPSAKASAISVSTSEGWDSDGAGFWSTFAIQVGTPPQTARVLFSSAGYETWIVDPQGCPPDYTDKCAFNRGNVIATGNSTSWAYIRITELSLQTNLGYVGNGQYGYDTVELGSGYPTSGGPKLDKQIVASIASPDFWLGQIGLDPAPSNFTTLNDPQPSLMWNLVNQSIIPSTTWSYTAGAAYRYNRVQGSLTLGGYDSSRFSAEKNVTSAFNNDVARRFVVELRSINYISTGLSTVTTSTTLMSGAISIYIDSTIPYIYLPTTVCDNFAAAFGLEWDNENRIYTLNNTMHTKLQATNPKFTFTVANSAGNTVDIEFPYAAFDLRASFPVIPIENNATNMFPLRRAANDTQYTLGRSFLQEAYLIADYDREEFSISPCIWPPTFTQTLVTINPPSSPDPKDSPSPQPTPIATNPSKIPLGGIIGGVIGGVVTIIILGFLGFCFIWKPRHRKATPKLEEALPDMGSNVLGKAELDTKKDVSEESAYDEAERYREIERKRLAVELSGTSTPIVYHELDSHIPVEVSEMDSNVPVGSELPNSQVFGGSELPNSQIHEK